MLVRVATLFVVSLSKHVRRVCVCECVNILVFNVNNGAAGGPIADRHHA